MQHSQWALPSPKTRLSKLTLFLGFLHLSFRLLLQRAALDLERANQLEVLRRCFRHLNFLQSAVRETVTERIPGCYLMAEKDLNQKMVLNRKMCEMCVSEIWSDEINMTKSMVTSPPPVIGCQNSRRENRSPTHDQRAGA
jgi:hypothetical protein